jgi:sugar/nucleoside kinase (ribokinase family)
MAQVWTMGEMLVEIMRPEAGMALGEVGEFLGPYPSGAPAIFIDTVARLGHSAAIIGGVGEDDFGNCVLDRLKGNGVDTRFVKRVPDRSTAVAFVTYREDGSRSFIFHIDGTPAVMASFPMEAADEGATYFHLMGCSLMANEQFRLEILKAVEGFYAAGARISFDPNIRPELLGKRALMDVIGPILLRSSVLLPGEAELRLIGGDEHIQNCVAKLFDNPILQLIVLKRGKAGATVYSRDGTVAVPAFPIREVDPTGAGDCFDAGFLCGLLDGKPLEECARIAAAVGALNAAAFGPMEGVISPSTVATLLAANPSDASATV